MGTGIGKVFASLITATLVAFKNDLLFISLCYDYWIAFFAAHACIDWPILLGVGKSWWRVVVMAVS